jgi:hypothetical protein
MIRYGSQVPKGEYSVKETSGIRETQGICSIIEESWLELSHNSSLIITDYFEYGKKK